jgi:hypothetical protein
LSEVIRNISYTDDSSFLFGEHERLIKPVILSAGALKSVHDLPRKEWVLFININQ